MIALPILSDPAIDGDAIVFVCDSAVWEAPATGGRAHRKTDRFQSLTTPILDSSREIIAFAAANAGPAQVCVVRRHGRRIRQLSYFSDACRILGWAKDGRILFTSSAGRPFRHLSHIWYADPESGHIEAGAREPANSSSLRDGITVFSPPAVAPRTWCSYRGGARGEIWCNAQARRFKLLRPTLDNIATPLLCRGRIYFVADENGQTNLFSCSLGGAELQNESYHLELAVHSPASDGSRIIYCVGGDLFLFQPPGPPVCISIELAETVANVAKVSVATGLQDIAASVSDSVFAICTFGQILEYDLSRRRWTTKTLPDYCSHLRYLPDDTILAVVPGVDADQLAIVAPRAHSYISLKSSANLGRIEILEVADNHASAVVANDRNELFSVISSERSCIHAGPFRIRRHSTD